MFITIKINSPVVGAVNWSVVQVLWKDCAHCEICQKRLLFKVNKGQQKRQSLETRKRGHITVAGYPAQVVSLLWALMSSWIFNNVSDSVTYFRKPNRHLHKKGVYPDSSIRITVEAHKKKSPCFLVEWMLGQQQQMSMIEDAMATWWSCLWV